MSTNQQSSNKKPSNATAATTSSTSSSLQVALTKFKDIRIQDQSNNNNQIKTYEESSSTPPRYSSTRRTHKSKNKSNHTQKKFTTYTTTSSSSSSTSSSSNNNSNKKNNTSFINETAKVSIETTHFQSFLKSCKDTKRFKVYKPQSNATKIQLLHNNIHLEYLSNGINLKIQKSNDDNNNNGQEDEEETRNVSLLDGLIVLPDTKKIQYAYLHSDSPQELFDQNPLAYEMKLRQQIFPKNDTITATSSTSNNHNNHPNIKISCANCLLNYHPNGFVCILSSSPTTLQHIIQLSYQRKQMKVENNVTFHSDHVDYLCFVNIGFIKDLFVCKKKCKRNTKSRSKYGKGGNSSSSSNSSNDQYQKRIFQLKEILKEQGIPIIRNNDNDKGDDAIPIDIKIGHHLSSVLTMLQKNTNNSSFMVITLIQKQTKVQQNNNNDNNDEHHDDNDDQTTKIKLVWELDISGGKRHLGEDSISCAIRETEEETSLLMDESWFVNEYGDKEDGGCGGGGGNENNEKDENEEKDEEDQTEGKRKVKKSGSDHVHITPSKEVENKYYFVYPPSEMID